MLFTEIGKYIISNGLSIILNPGGTAGKNSCMLCTSRSLSYAPFAILHSTLSELTFKIDTGSSDVCSLFEDNFCGLNPSNLPIESFGSKFIILSHCIML